MIWLLYVIVWIAAPFVELGIIIALLVVNGKRKKQIAELEKQLKNQPEINSGQELKVQEPKAQAAKPWLPGKKAPALAPVPASASVPASTDKSRWAASPGFSRGTAALVAGVVMVVLAGLIFATTAWHILPDICKAGFVLGFAVLFFAASYLAERFLKIRRTGCAFYILGSIFLLLSVLAVGYFKLLGAEFVLTGYHRWRVLCAGSFVTTAALFGGCGRFRDRIYTCCCLWGVTISILLLMLALRLDYRGVACGMMYYSTALLALRQIRLYRGRVKPQREQPEQSEQPEPEQRERQTDNGDAWRPGRNLDTFVPMHFAAVCIFLMPMLLVDYLEAIMHPGGTVRITLWALGATACLVAGMAVMAWNRREAVFRVLYQICCIGFFHYGALWLPVEFVCQMSVGAILSGVYFLASRRFGWEREQLRCPQGDVAYTAVLAADTVMLVMKALSVGLYAQSSLELQVAASATMVLLAAVMVWWGKTYPSIRALMPVELFCLTATVPGIIHSLTGRAPEAAVVIWIYMLFMMAWDIKSKERFWMALTVLGALCQMAYMGEESKQFALLLLFAGYFFCRIRQMPEQERTWPVRAAFAYFLECACFLAEEQVPEQVVSLLPVLALLVAGYGLAARGSRLLKKEDWFWDVAGVMLFVLAMGQFAWGYGYSLWNLIPLLAVFVVLYWKFYRGSGLWQHFVLSMSMVFLPFVLAEHYEIETQLLYGGVLAAVLLSGVLMRRLGNILELSEDGKKAVRVDWYHILIGLALVPMTVEAPEKWQFIYLLLLVLYVLQYAVLPKLSRPAVTIAECLLVLAWWTQPFFSVPDRLWLEIQMIPVFLIIRFLPSIWGEAKAVLLVQRGLDMACLVVLVAGAFIRADVANGLILEGICLTVFILSHFRKSVWWLRTSGIVMVVVALYMTRRFWLSISWWIYLLTAGLGLIAFAAWNEIRKRGKE